MAVIALGSSMPQNNSIKILQVKSTTYTNENFKINANQCEKLNVIKVIEFEHDLPPSKLLWAPIGF